MIGSHNSFSYLNAKNRLINLFPSLWRCQTLTIKDQYDFGVRLFDIRVNKDIQEEKFTWQVSHGLAKFNQNFATLNAICSYFKKQYPEAVIRIILESDCDNKEIVDKFTEQGKKAIKSYKDIIWTITLKNPWTNLQIGRNFKECKDYACHLFNWDPSKSFWYNIKHLDLSAGSIKKWAKKHNPKITKEMMEDENIIYFMDYAGIYH